MLFEEGLMYQESLTQDRALQWKLNEQFSDYNVIGSFIGQHQNYAMSWQSPKWKDYIALEPLEGPDGVKYGVWSAPTGRIDIVINAETEYPATAFRWMDWLYSQEGTLFRRHGLENEHWRVATPGEVDIAGNQAKWTKIADPVDFIIDSFIQSDWGGIGGTGDFFSISKDPNELTDDGRTKDQVRYQAALVMNRYVQPLDEQWTSPPVPDEITEEYSIIKTNVLDVVNQYTAMFIVGQKKIATQWSEFQSELKKAGLDRYVELSQIAYDRFQK
jgi:putative aldouronate transport system substrate-binding protein